jgi:hypothetical protein
MNSITGLSGNDNITGTLADDEILSGDGNDTITGSAGNDVIYGGKDTDTASYTSAYNNYNVTALYNGKNNSFSGFTISDLMGVEGVDTVFSDVEYLTFSSGAVTYKVDNGNLSLIDINLPTIAVASSATSLISSQTAILTFTLSESSANFLASDVTATGGTLSNFSGSGTTYTALFTPTANSTTNGVVSVSSGVFTDAAGNANADGSDANNTITMAVDTVAPAIALSASKASLGVGETASLTFTLNEASTTFTAADVTTTGGTLTNFSGSGTTYTALFTPTANSTTNGVVRVASGVFTDAAGNANADGSDTNNTVTMAVDTVAPAIALSTSKASLSVGESSTLTFTLSEASTTFTASDVTTTGGTLSNFSGSGTTYTALFTPTANSTTNGVVRVASGVFTDAAGNANADGSDANNTVTMSVDTVAPAIALSTSKASLSVGETASLTFTLSEASTTFTASDVTATGGTLSNFSGSGTTYSALFTSTANSTISCLVNVGSGVFSDAAGNTNANGIGIALDYEGNAGKAFRLYSAAFNRLPDQGGLGYQMNDLAIGVPLWRVAANFIASPEGQGVYPLGTNNEAFVTTVYRNVLGRTPDAEGLAYHVNNLELNGFGRHDVLLGFSESTENKVKLMGLPEYAEGMVFVPVG